MSQSQGRRVGFRGFANKPHYIFRPSQALRRMSYSPAQWDINQTTVAPLPWQMPLECWPRDLIGSSVVRTGIYDLLATEAVFRLTEPGETAVDAGANVGYMTSALARALGEGGSLLSFEPHPLVYGVLRRNVDRWVGIDGVASIRAHRIGLSDRAGAGAMATDDHFAGNHGLGRVLTAAEDRGASQVPISLERLDGMTQGPIGVLKLDVEGHELAALRGAAALLARRSVRDIIFEEHAPYPSPVTVYLEGHGFTILGLEQHLTGPRLSDPLVAHHANPWNPPALIATRDGTRVCSRLAPRGWLALRRRNAALA